MKKENRGGAREGAGRPKKVPKEYSEKFKRDLRKALRKKAREAKKTEHDILVELLYDERTQESVRLGAYNKIADVFVVKETKTTVDVNEIHKVIILPPIMKRPAQELESQPVIEVKPEEEKDV